MKVRHIKEGMFINVDLKYPIGWANALLVRMIAFVK